MRREQGRGLVQDHDSASGQAHRGPRDRPRLRRSSAGRLDGRRDVAGAQFGQPLMWGELLPLLAARRGANESSVRRRLAGGEQCEAHGSHMPASDGSRKGASPCRYRCATSPRQAAPNHPRRRVYRTVTPSTALPIENGTMATRVESEPGERLLNRELSQLEFHARVLELALDESLPVLERVRYCAIFSSNIDEFFQVRVAGLLEQAESGIAMRSPDGLRPQQALAQIRERVLGLVANQSRAWRRELRPALAAHGIVVGSVEDCDEKELRSLERAFEREIYPVLTPLAVGPGQPFPYISGLSLSLAVFAQDPDAGEDRFARVKIPEGLPRFLPIGKRELYVPLEQVIAHFLPTLFPGTEIVERAAFRVTRDADFEVSDDAADLLEAVESELRKRRFGDVRPGGGQRVGVLLDGRSPDSRPRRRRDADLPHREPARSRGPDGARAARPPRSEGGALGPDPHPPIRRSSEQPPAHLRRDPPRRHRRASAVRLVPHELRGLRRGSRPRPGCHRR